jgi:trehalose-6-phosphate synthase
MRHARSLAIVERTTAQSWAVSFLEALSECPSRRTDS